MASKIEERIKHITQDFEELPGHIIFMRSFRIELMKQMEIDPVGVVVNQSAVAIEELWNQGIAIKALVQDLKDMSSVLGCPECLDMLFEKLNL